MKELADTKLHLISHLWPGLFVILFVLQILFPYRGWLILLIGFGGAFLFSYLYARSLYKGLQVRREMRFGWANVGDTLEERFTLINKGWAPATWIEVIDHSTIPGSQANIVTGVGSQNSTSWIYQLLCTRRGLYTIGPTSLVTGDLFGIFRVNIYDKASTVLLVTPTILPLPAIQVAGGGRVGEGRPVKKALEETISVNGIRDYIPGDNLHRIHWPTSARRNQLFVKIFEHTPISDWWIVLDLFTSVQSGEGPDSTEETGVTLAASLADRGLKAGLAVGLIVSSKEPVWFTPNTGATQNIKLMQYLAQVTPGTQPVQEVLKFASTSLHHQSSLILITPDLSAGWLEIILLLHQRDIIPTILLLDHQPFEGKDSGNLLLSELSNLGIYCSIITPDMLKLSVLAQKHSPIWQWRTLGTGRVIPLYQSGDVKWKVLK